VYRKELAYYFSTWVAYISIALYLLAISLMLWVVPGQWNIIDSGYAQADGLFWLSPWLLLLLCPALTMHLFAEERKTGTWDVLRTKPVSLIRIVLGKYFAAWTIVVLAQLPCLIHFAAVSALAEPAGNVDSGAFLGGFIGLLLVSAALTAIGTWTSTLSKSQIVCFLIALIVGFLLFYGFDLLAALTSQSTSEPFFSLQDLGLNAHLSSLSVGVLDLRDVVYFLSVSAFFIALTLYSLRRQ